MDNNSPHNKPPATTGEPLLLTAADVGALLRLTEEQVRNLHRSGALPAKRIGKVNRWTRASVERFVSKLEAGE